MADDQDDKTEEPTDKKKEDAREDGNVLKSQDVAAVVSLFISLLAIFALSGLIAEQVVKIMLHYISLVGTEIDAEFFYALMLFTIKESLLILIPFAAVIMIAGIFANVSQFGFLFTTKVLEPKFDKLNFISGMKNVFGLKKLLEGFKSTLKGVTAMGIGFLFFWFFIQELPLVSLFPIRDQMLWMRDKMFILYLVMLVILTVFAVIDFVIQQKNYIDNLKMSKQEIKDEYKNMEGDPQVKAKIRQIQMQAAQKRMMAAVPDADVVVTNPTHYAVAIKYDDKKNRAPLVIAKGTDNLALKIKEIARENSIHIYQNPTLARSLYKEVKVEQEIPEALFSAVAEVLAYVYKLSRR